MNILSSIFNFGNINPSVDLSKVTRIVRVPDNPHNPHLSMLYFYGLDKQGREIIIQIWLYNSTSRRQKELEIIAKKYPSLTV